MSELYFSPKVSHNNDENTLPMKRVFKSEKLSELDEPNVVEEPKKVEEPNVVEEPKKVEEPNVVEEPKEVPKSNRTFMSSIKNCYYETLNCLFNFIFTNVHKVEQYLVSNEYMTINPTMASRSY